MRIIQASASFNNPSFPTLLVISPLLSVCPGTAREREANRGNLKLISGVWYGNKRNRQPQLYLHLNTVPLMYQMLPSHTTLWKAVGALGEKKIINQEHCRAPNGLFSFVAGASVKARPTYLH